MDVFTGDPRSIDTDLVIVTAFEGSLAPAAVWSGATRGEVERAIQAREFTGKLFEHFLTPVADPAVKPRRVALAGLGKPGDFTTDRARRTASAAAIMARQKRIPRITFAIDGVLENAEMVQAIAEGLTLGEFEAGHYKTAGYEPFGLSAVGIAVSESLRAVAVSAAQRGRLIGEYCNVARQLGNEPGNALPPAVLADRLVSMTRGGGLTVDVLDHHELERLGMGMLLGVGRGSAEPPCLVAIRYEPVGAPATPVIGFVGKGITFDTGGISIKPAADMERMKNDMAGGAAVACALRAIADLQIPVRCVGVIPIAENMPGGRALRPGDILKSAAGLTVEVVNTDAEGRLILGDGLWYARTLGATHLIDIATLTGAISVALGRITTGLFGTPPSFADQVRAAAERAGDRCWPLPLFDEYKEQLRSDVADMINTGGRLGGAITAALFLKEFTGGLPWAHLDIAGTGWAEESNAFMPKGPTGVGVRTLIEIAENLKAKNLGTSF
jgi:leucyl aminopeptidase